MENCFSGVKRLLLTFLLFSVSYLALAQKAINGKIIGGDNKQPLAGATITNLKTKTQAVSDVNGSFSILAQDNDVLQISNVGYANREIRAADAGAPIELTITQANLSEVVVTALGIKKEAKKIGYSVQEVKGADLLKARESNPVNSLTGKVAGLNVGINQEILASPTVLLRGSPLNFYVVDGIPINSDTWNLSPDDIETYTVLKGPTAAALYGSRGINGAILITTKRGKKNNKGFTVEVNSSTQFNRGFIANPKVQNEYGGGDNQQYAFGDYNANGTGSGKNDKDYDVWDLV
ncbi:MAG: TonB-dependent receptor plug domain-containing protein [Chitinophagaceae bacterium]